MIFRCSSKRSCFAVLEGDGYGVVSAKGIPTCASMIVTCSYWVEEKESCHPQYERSLFFAADRVRYQVRQKIIHPLLHRGSVRNFLVARHQSGNVQFAYLIGRIVIDDQVESSRHMEGFSIERCAVLCTQGRGIELSDRGHGEAQTTDGK